MKKLARRFRELVEALGSQASPLPLPCEATVNAAMADMRLPDAVLHALNPLTEFEFVFVEGAVKPKFDQVERPVTLLSRSNEEYYLIHLPAALISRETDEGKRLVASLNLLFPSDSRVFVVGQEVQVLPLPLQNILKVTSLNGPNLTFVPWLHIRGEREEPQDATLLLTAFELSEEPADGRAADGLPVRKPQQQELATCTRAFAAQLSVVANPQATFEDFIRRLNLSERPTATAVALWVTDTGTAANRLFTWAEQQGKMVLGSVVVQLIEHAPYNDDATAMMKMLSDCGLVDPDRLAALRLQSTTA